MNNQTVIDVAKAELSKLPVDTLVERLLASEAARKRTESERKDTDQNLAKLERIVDAMKELLWTELFDAKLDGDPINLANEARRRLRQVRETQEIPF